MRSQALVLVCKPCVALSLKCDTLFAVVSLVWRLLSRSLGEERCKPEIIASCNMSIPNDLPN